MAELPDERFRFVIRHPQAGGHVTHEMVAAHVQHVGVPGGRFEKDCHVGRAAADVHHGDARLPFVVGQHGLRGGQRLEHQVFDFDAVLRDAVRQVGDGGCRAGDEAGIHFQPVGKHADRILDVLIIIDSVAARNCVDDIAIVWQRNIAGLVQRALAVLRRDLASVPAQDGDAFAADCADVRPGDADVGCLERYTGCGFGCVDCLADAGCRFDGVDDHAATQAACRHPAHADDAQRIVVIEFADEGTHFRRADIEGTDQLTHGSPTASLTTTRRVRR